MGLRLRDLDELQVVLDGGRKVSGGAREWLLRRELMLGSVIMRDMRLSRDGE